MRAHQLIAKATVARLKALQLFWNLCSMLTSVDMWGKGCFSEYQLKLESLQCNAVIFLKLKKPTTNNKN